MSKIFVTFILLTGFSVNLLSQATSSASIGAMVIQPISQNLMKTVDMNFGTIAIIFAGMVEMVPGGVHPGKSSIMLPVKTGTFTAVSFAVEGTAAYAFTVTVPSSPLEFKSGDNTLVVDSFQSDPVINTGSGLFSGVYVSITPLNVIVNYN